jgi:hypothetical protein
MVTEFASVHHVIKAHSLQIKSIALASGLSERTLHNALKGHHPPRETTQRLIIQGVNALLLAQTVTDCDSPDLPSKEVPA